MAWTLFSAVPKVVQYLSPTVSVAPLGLAAYAYARGDAPAMAVLEMKASLVAFLLLAGTLALYFGACPPAVREYGRREKYADAMATHAKELGVGTAEELFYRYLGEEDRAEVEALVAKADAGDADAKAQIAARAEKLYPRNVRLALMNQFDREAAEHPVLLSAATAMYALGLVIVLGLLFKRFWIALS